MKALIILAILGTLGVIFFQYSRNKNLKKLFISLATFIAILSLGFMGAITRQVMPIFLAHVVLVLLAWGSLFVYFIRDKYYAWVIFSPVITIGIFLALEFFTGSGHEAGAFL